MTHWTRESLLAAAKQYYPNVRECFLTPMIDLYLRDPEKLKEIVKQDMKREAKLAKSKDPIVPRQSLFENVVTVAPPEQPEPENIPTGVLVEELNAEEAAETVVGQRVGSDADTLSGCLSESRLDDGRL